jgi:hypothetical protein
MATFQKFQDFTEQLVLAKHDFSAAGHTFRCYLSNAVPSTSADAIKTDLAEIAGGNGYTAGGHDMQNAVTETAGTATVTAIDIIITASGAVGPFQYVVAVNDSQTTPAKPLVNWWDYGSALTLQATETFTIDFGTAWFTLV